MSKADEMFDKLGYRKKDLVDIYKNKSSTVFGLEKILDCLIENDICIAKIGNIEIISKGIILDTAKGKRQVFEVQRKVEE